MEKEQQDIIEGKIEINYKIINDELMIVESYCNGVLLETSYYMKEIHDKNYESEKLKREQQEKYLAEKYGIDIERNTIYYFNIGPDSHDVICNFEYRRSYKLNEKRKTAGWSRHDIKHNSEKMPVKLTREEAYQKDEKEKIESEKRNEYYSIIRKDFLNCSEEKICDDCSEEKICDKKIETILREFFPCCKRITHYNANQNYVGVITPLSKINQESVDKCRNCESYQKYKDSEFIHIVDKNYIDGIEDEVEDELEYFSDSNEE